MDVMGIRHEEMIDGVEIGAVHEFLEGGRSDRRADLVGESARLGGITPHDADDFHAFQALIDLCAELGDEAGSQNGDLDIGQV